MFLKRHPILVYTLGRVGLFLAVFGMLALAGARGLLLIAAAFLLSGLLSLVLLDGPRSGMSQRVSAYFGRINDRIDAASRSEDEPDDADVSGSRAPSTDETKAKTDSQPGQQQR